MSAKQQHRQRRHDEDIDTGADTAPKARAPSRPDDPAVVAAAAGKTTRERSTENQRPQQPSRRHNRGPPFDDDDEPERLTGGDLLVGAKQIAAYITALGIPTDEDDVYYARRAKKLPIGKYGAELIASKTKLNRYTEKIARGPTAA